MACHVTFSFLYFLSSKKLPCVSRVTLGVIPTLATDMEYLQTFTVFWCGHSCKIIDNLALLDRIPEVGAADTF